VAAFPETKWSQLADDKEYKMAILDFILAGGDGYTMVQAGARCSSMCQCRTPRGSLSKAVLILRCYVHLHNPHRSKARRGLAASGSGWDVVLDPPAPDVYTTAPASNVEPSGFTFKAAFQRFSLVLLEL
jgi:hypothetical protein